MPETKGPDSEKAIGEDDGKRIFALGNKRLLGIVLMASLLCVAFFTVGYLAGRNSLGTDGAVTAAATAADRGAVRKSETKHEALPASGNAAAVTPTAVAGALPAAKSTVADIPVVTEAQPLTSAPHDRAPADNDVSVSVAETGAFYWQVYALGRPAADNQVKTLRTRELPVILVESSRAHAYRVLVGPYRTASAFAEAKEKLKALGYPSVIPFRP